LAPRNRTTPYGRAPLDTTRFVVEQEMVFPEFAARIEQGYFELRVCVDRSNVS